MGVRERPADIGARDAERLLADSRREIRETRQGAGLSQAAVARAAGMSPAAYGRFERGETKRIPLAYIASSARAVGLKASIRLFPAGVPVRDAGQLRLEADFLGVLGDGMVFRPEVPLPIPGDPRAWDGMVSGHQGMAFVECEVRLGDMQALARRVELKLRDDPRGEVLILVVRASRHNRTVLAEHRELLRPLLPLDSPAILRALRSGRVPPASGLLVLRWRGASDAGLSRPGPVAQRVRTRSDLTPSRSAAGPEGTRPASDRRRP